MSEATYLNIMFIASLFNYTIGIVSTGYLQLIMIQ